MKYFGPIAHPHLQATPAPTFDRCIWCDEEFSASDSGFAMPLITTKKGQQLAYYHRECLIRSIMGSVGHQRHQCRCYGGKTDDPEGMTPRQAARAAYVEYALSRGDAEF